MGLVRNVTKNALAMASVQLLSQISTFILSIYLARYLGSVNYGAYTLAFSLTSLVFILADFNLGFQMVVEVAPNKELAPQRLTNTLFLRAILGGVCILITLVIVIAENFPAAVSDAIMIIAVATAVNWLYLSFTSMYTSFEKMHLILLTAAIERLFTVGTAVVLLVLGFGLDAVVLVVLVGALIQFTVGYLVCSRLVVRPARRPKVREAGRQLRGAVPYAISGVAISSLYAVNAVLVQTIIVWTGGSTTEALQSTGWFNLPFNMVTALIAVPNVLIFSLLPVISRMYKTSVEMTQLTQQKVMKYMFALGLPIAVGGVILASRIILFFYGPEYSSAVPVFQILIPAVAISFFDSGMGSVLASAKHIRLITVANSIGAVANVLLCFALIPFLHEEGAALAFTVAYFFLVSTTFYFLTVRVFKVNLVDIVVKPGLAAAGMGLVLLLIPQANLFVALAVGAVVYFVLLFMLKAINQEDKEILKKILKKGT